MREMSFYHYKFGPHVIVIVWDGKDVVDVDALCGSTRNKD